MPAMLTGPGGGTAVLRSGSFSVTPCPGPDDINWPTLWCTWQMVRRGVRDGLLDKVRMLCMRCGHAVLRSSGPASCAMFEISTHHLRRLPMVHSMHDST